VCGASACSYRAADNPEGQDRLAAFHQGLQELGWSVGRNVRIDTRWGEDDADRERKYAAELVALAPDLILASGTLSVAALQHVSRTLPIVFAAVTDPVGAGFVESLARPGGNATGFMIYEYSLSAKWLELLKQIAPNVTRVAVIRNSDNPAGMAVFGAIQNAAQSMRVEVSPVSISVRRCWRIRTHYCGLRPLAEWRPRRNTNCVGGSTRSHHHGCCPL
jgi:putative tryptophan/tyrosine transport system substrate-binding protein